jgi:uncharacterized membrane protein AbrB (regulator of aidB expression)
MNNTIGKLAILFAGFIVAGVFMNLYAIMASLMLIPMLISLQLNFGVDLHKQLSTPLYWICLAAGVITAFLVMRPAWNATEKKPKPKIEAAPESKPE